MESNLHNVNVKMTRVIISVKNKEPEVDKAILLVKLLELMMQVCTVESNIE